MYASALEFAGLYTFPNPLSKVPAGALLQADNVTANKDGIGEIRRGFNFISGTAGNGVIDQIFSYQNRLIVHSYHATSSTVGYFTYDSNGSFLWNLFPYPQTYFPPSTAIRIHGTEANKNFYYTLDSGINKITSYSPLSPVMAGMAPGLDGSGVLAGSGSGFLAAGFQCVYQIVFGYVDQNGNLILGAPSQRILVTNSTGGSDNVTLTFTVPTTDLTSFFYQIYRTPQTAYSATPSLNVQPGVELQLAAQFDVTSSAPIVYTDVTTDALLGATLYTSPSQEGALQANNIPPLSTDLCLFSQMMFYSNIAMLSTFQFNLISVGSPNGIQIDDTFTINALRVTGKATQNNASAQFAVYTSGTVSQNIDTTARNLVNCINNNVSGQFGSHVYAFYISGYNDIPGKILLQSIDYNHNNFAVATSRPSAFSPTISSSIYLNPTYSTSEKFPNGIMVSKVGQPEAVPSTNIIFVGGGDQPILRVLPLRDRVIVLKTDGVYVVTGSTPQNLTITLLDSTIICIAPESATLLNNSVYCMSNQGVVSITESGVTIQSRAIEEDLLRLTTSAYTYFKQACTGIGYESERLYILTMPTATTDQYGTQAWCYNWVTNAWTHWTVDISAGLVNPFDNKLYIGRTNVSVGEQNSFNRLIYQERKNYLYTDFMDEQFPLTITNVDATGTQITVNLLAVGRELSSFVGYFLEQTIAGVQYIAMITDFSVIDFNNRLLTVDLVNSTTPNIVIPWALDTADIDVSIPVNLVYAPLTAGFPHLFKDWGRVNFWFNGGNFQRIQSGFITDIQGPTQYLSSIITGGYGFGSFGSTPFGGTSNYPQSIQTLVPTQVAKARWIQPTLSLSFPQARLSLLGVTASYEIISDVSG